MVGLPAAASVVIIDDDNNALLTMANVAVSEADGTASVIVSVDVPISGGFTVDVATAAGGTATAGVDYIALPSQTLIFAGDTPGETQTIMVIINDDAVAEGVESFMVSLSVLGGTSSTVGLPVAATVSIADNDSAALSMADVEVSEGDGTAMVTVRLDNAVQGGFTVDAMIGGGSATADVDYRADSMQTLTFAGTAESQILTVTIIDDSDAEDAETLMVSLGNLQETSVMVGLPDAASVVIIDDDNNALLTMANVAVSEADGTASVIVSVDVPISGGFTVDVATAAGGTATAGVDYIALPSQTLIFAGDTPGETQTIMVIINDDAVAEGVESFMVSLSVLGGTSSTVGLPVAATVSIADNDSAALSMADVEVSEGDGTAMVTVRLDTAVQGGFTVDAMIGGGSATADVDYRADSMQTLTFAGTAESQILTVTIIDDSDAENAETLMVSLGNLQETSVMVGLPAAASVIIIDDDNNALLTMANVAVSEADGTASVIVRVDVPISGGFTVDVATVAGGTATAGVDYIALPSQTLIFAGDTSGETQTIMVIINDDAVAEGVESFMVSLSILGGTSSTVGLPDAATVSIADNDSAALSMADVEVSEGDGTAMVTVRLDTAVQGGFTVDAMIGGGSATADVDYRADSMQTLTFAGTAESQILTVTIIDDSDAEDAETLMVSLGNLQETSVMVGLPDAASVVIIDDDNNALLTMANVAVSEADGTDKVAEGDETLMVSLPNADLCRRYSWRDTDNYGHHQR